MAWSDQKVEFRWFSFVVGTVRCVLSFYLQHLKGLWNHRRSLGFFLSFATPSFVDAHFAEEWTSEKDCKRGFIRSRWHLRAIAGKNSKLHVHDNSNKNWQSACVAVGFCFVVLCLAAFGARQRQQQQKKKRNSLKFGVWVRRVCRVMLEVRYAPEIQSVP